MQHLFAFWLLSSSKKFPTMHPARVCAKHPHLSNVFEAVLHSAPSCETVEQFVGTLQPIMIRYQSWCLIRSDLQQHIMSLSLSETVISDHESDDGQQRKDSAGLPRLEASVR